MVGVSGVSGLLRCRVGIGVDRLVMGWMGYFGRRLVILCNQGIPTPSLYSPYPKPLVSPPLISYEGFHD
jgi:hypothetical protein